MRLFFKQCLFLNQQSGTIFLLDLEWRTVMKWHLEASACNNAVIPDTTENKSEKKDKSLYQTWMARMEDRQEQ